MDKTQKTAVLLRASEVAPIAALSRSMVYKLLACGALPSIRIGSSVRVPLKSLEDWIAKNTVEAK